jgi:LysR family glycine cleavage system transcriptional activator
MQSLKRSLPGLNALAVFECAAGHENLTLAARDLSITQSAVSRHVRQLEAETGLQLFERRHRLVRLTGEGRALAEAVRSGLGQVRDAIEQLQRRHNPALATIACSYDVAHLWLMPRLATLRKRLGSIELRLITSDSYVDFDAGDVDLSLRFGPGPWAPAESLRLLSEEVFPVAAPALVRELGLTRSRVSPAALAQLPLLELAGRLGQDIIGWRRWLSSAGIDLRRRVSPARFNSYVFLLNACQEGQGIALGWRGIVDDLLRRKVLLRLGQHRLTTEAGLFAVYRGGARPIGRRMAEALAGMAPRRQALEPGRDSPV